MNNNKHYPESFTGLRVAVLAAMPTTGVIGGAERFYDGLVGGLNKLGCKAEIISIPADEPDFESIIDNYDRCARLDLSEFDVVISTKAPTYVVDHPNHVLYLVHTVRVFDDMFERVFNNPTKVHYEQRAQIHARDFAAFSKVKARFAIGHEVAERLFRWRGLNAEVLHPPLGFSEFKCNKSEDYFFLPGRLHDWKRVDLVIKAILQSKLPMRLKIAGTGEAEAKLKDIANGDPRIEFLGRIDDANLVNLYSRCIAVPFTPAHEDYGYITLEAFASKKPVITCNDSGEPARIVENGLSGLICNPDPFQICQAMESLFTNRESSASMGDHGFTWVSGMDWSRVASKLLKAALEEKKEHNDIKQVDKKLKVAVFDMQPIDPPVGGGRLRLLGLYHNLGDNIDCTYVGSYDWPGESFRQHHITSGLQEIDVPLSEKHHKAARELSSQAGGKTVIDISFSKLGNLSSDYLKIARENIKLADVVVFSHPWVYPLLEHDIRPGQTVIYDSQNVEGFLRAQLLDEANPVESELLRNVIEDELNLCRRADIVFVCSYEDGLRFNRLYRINASKLRLVPNGVMAFSYDPPDQTKRLQAKQTLHIQDWRLVAVFIGSAYGPNVEAANFIIDDIAPNAPDVLFVIAGGVGSQVAANRNNIHITGMLSEEEKALWLTASDIAINPMFSGSGTNIKMFDFMAFSLPVITTPTGARGIDVGTTSPFLVASNGLSSFLECIIKLSDEAVRQTVGCSARKFVENNYAWERISHRVGKIVANRHVYVKQPLPLFSLVLVISDSYGEFENLIRSISAQIDRDFELIIVDLNSQYNSSVCNGFGFPVKYLNLPYLSHGAARNAGAESASGKFIVLLSCDFCPDDYWLLNLRYLVSVAEENQDLIAWVPSSCNGGSLSPLNIMIRQDALFLAKGFDGNEIIDLEDPNAFLSRLRMLGSISHTHFLDSSVGGNSGRLRIAMMSTFGHKCGIGEYSSSLVKCFRDMDIDVSVISCRTANAGLPMYSLGKEMIVGWYYDDLNYVDSRIFSETANFIGMQNPRVLIVQYHPAFYSVDTLFLFVLDLSNKNVKVIVDNHKYRVEDSQALIKLCEMGASVVFHRLSEVKLAYENGLSAIHNPIGLDNNLPINKRTIYDRDWGSKPPLLITTGFLRAHKGVRTLLRAMPKVVDKFPGCKLRIQCSLYPSADSSEELELCLKLIDELDLSSNVELDTSFYEKDEMLKKLSDADLALLAYENSDEGGSAAAADCLSVGLPLIVSDAKIFHDISDYSTSIYGDFNVWANTIIDTLVCAERYLYLSARAHEYSELNDWRVVAKNILNKTLGYK